MPYSKNYPGEVIDVPGYKHVKWADVKAGDKVWLAGRAFGTPHAYGPHTVVSPIRRELENSRGVQFLEYPEDLIIPEGKS